MKYFIETKHFKPYIRYLRFIKRTTTVIDYFNTCVFVFIRIKMLKSNTYNHSVYFSKIK